MVKSENKTDEDKSDEEFIKSFLSKHWKAALIAIIGGIGVFIAGIIVVLWFIDYSGYGGTPLGSWTMSGIFDFLLNLILWEFMLVGIAAIAVALVVGLHWWKNLPDEEQEEIMDRPKRKETQKNIVYGSSGSVITFFTFLAFCIIVYLDGNWSVALGTLPFSYFVYSWLWAFVWVLIIIGIPIGVVLLLWLRRIVEKEQ